MKMLEFLFSDKSELPFYVGIKKQQAAMVWLYIKGYR
jgi:hypothetical protein